MVNILQFIMWGALAYLTVQHKKDLDGVERQTLSGVLRDDQRNAQRAFAVEFPIFVEVPQGRYQVRHYAAFFSTAKAAASSGSRICAARKRTTGTATPSPAR